MAARATYEHLQDSAAFIKSLLVRSRSLVIRRVLVDARSLVRLCRSETLNAPDAHAVQKCRERGAQLVRRPVLFSGAPRRNKKPRAAAGERATLALACRRANNLLLGVFSGKIRPTRKRTARDSCVF